MRYPSLLQSQQKNRGRLFAGRGDCLEGCFGCWRGCVVNLIGILADPFTKNAAEVLTRRTSYIQRRKVDASASARHGCSIRYAAKPSQWQCHRPRLRRQKLMQQAHPKVLGDTASAS